MAPHGLSGYERSSLRILIRVALAHPSLVPSTELEAIKSAYDKFAAQDGLRGYDDVAARRSVEGVPTTVDEEIHTERLATAEQSLALGDDQTKPTLERMFDAVRSAAQGFAHPRRHAPIEGLHI